MSPRAKRSTLRHAALSLAPPAAVAAFMGLVYGAPAATLAALAAIPWLAWRYDNATGTFLVLAVLFLLVLAIPALLLALMAVTH